MSHPTRLTLLETVRSTQTGRSWEEFVRLYGALIRRWLRQQGVRGSDADDIEQEVMATVVKEIGRFEHSGAPGAFRCWLRRITVNRMRRVWRRRASRRAEWAPSIGDLADELEDDRSRLTLVWEAQHDRFVLSELLDLLEGRFSRKSLEAFRRIAIEGQPAGSVAADLGMTLGAARVAQHRVLRALKGLGRGLIDGVDAAYWSS